MRTRLAGSHGASRLLAVVLALVVAGGMGGCGNAPGAARSLPADSTYLFEQLRRQQALYDTAWAPEDLVDALPSKAHRIAGHDYRASDEVLTGRFRAWTKAKAGITASFAVERVVDAREGAPRLRAQTLPVHVQVASFAEAERMGAGLVALGPAIVYLTAPSPGDQRWSVAWNGQLVGPIEGQRIEAPAFIPLHGEGRATTLDALYAAADRNHVAAQQAAPTPGVAPGSRGPAVELVPVVWRIRNAAGESDRTWLRIEGLEMTVLRPKGFVSVSWRPQGDQFVAQVQGWSMSLGTKGPPALPWLTDATSFEPHGDGWELRAPDGRVTARLVREGSPPRSKSTMTSPPKVDAWVRAHLADGKAGRGVYAVDPAAIVGRWIVPGFDPAVVLTFSANGRWEARTSCESGTGAGGGSGRFRLLRTGFLLTTAFPVATVGCTDPKTPPPADAKAISSADQAASVLLEGNALTLFDRSGKRLGTLHRSR